MPRIPLSSLIEALEAQTDPGDPDMVILNGPVYFMMVGGKINVVYEVNPNTLFGLTETQSIRLLREHKIPKIWR